MNALISFVQGIQGVNPTEKVIILLELKKKSIDSIEKLKSQIQIAGGIDLLFPNLPNVLRSVVQMSLNNMEFTLDEVIEMLGLVLIGDHQKMIEVNQYQFTQDKVNHQDSTGNTVLHDAIISGNVDFVNVLAAKGADPNIPNIDGNRPIHLAVMQNNARLLVKALLDNTYTIPIQINAKNNEGNTALHLLAMLKAPDGVVATYLLDKQADPNLQNHAGNTALHLAVQPNMTPEATSFVLNLLNTDNINPEIKDKSGVTIKQKAQQFNLTGLIKQFTKVTCQKKGATKGEIDIMLSWANKNDLDLHVICPCGTRIFFGNKRCNYCEGMLDIDMNVQYSNALNDAVEHIYFLKNNAKRGIYQVEVNHYRNHNGVENTTKYWVYLTIAGNVIEEHEGHISERETKRVTSFKY
jgi:hypothetical protein